MSKIKELEANLRSLHNKLALQRPSNSFVLGGGTNLLNLSFTEGRGLSARGSRNEAMSGDLSGAAYTRSPQSAGRHAAKSFDRDTYNGKINFCGSCRKQKAVASRVTVDAPCILRSPAAKFDATTQVDLASSKDKDMAEVKKQMN